MEVKIGVQHAQREIVIESAQTADEVKSTVETALGKNNEVLVLEDEHGRKVMVPGDRLAYVEIGETSGRKVGFGTL